MSTGATSDHPNAVRVRALFAAFRAGDVDAIRAALAEDAVWQFPGRRGGLAGSHRGHAGILAFLGRVVALSGGSFELELGEVVANDRVAVALFRGHGRRDDGRTLDNPTCLVIEMAGGRAFRIREFVWDLADVEDFWS